ncbi:hypothetical protein LFL96_18450 [Paraburkholderia sp. D15]|uniref:hypothetical protein n=1 Tax=Paraburkholderia sp. D15 TaxID=2880218 RepID=UPI00247A6EE7|nr:hypothetical protein [Paraburkholderia sp. D15]WGS49702.1 hypothetical protein LFL96_18450 [Paraburkholderia sp. D15]
MRNNALYFPYISIPNSAWTVRTLLYWDKLSSIVPIEYANRPEDLDDFMRNLVDAELVTPIIPAQFLYRVGQFETVFIELLDTRLKRIGRLRVDTKPHPRTRIHVEKLGKIPEVLVERGLAEQHDSSWYSVDTPVANLFMAYLAVCLGGLDEIDAAPVTNRWEYGSLFGYGPAVRRGKRPEHQKARNQIIECLLPVPEGQVTLAELVEFKSRHGALLPALRTMIEARSAQIAMLPDADDRVDAVRAFVSESQLQVDELCDAMRFSWKKLAFSALIPLTGSGLQWTATPADNPAAFAGTGLSFLGAVYGALSSIGGLNDIQRRRPLAYVAHAHRRFNLAGQPLGELRSG